jgi:hypothetical protein
MRTTHYNPSTLEVDFAKAFKELSPQIESQIKGSTVVDIQSDHQMDNPQVTFKVQDKEGDMHEIVVKIIQRPDFMVK